MMEFIRVNKDEERKDIIEKVSKSYEKLVKYDSLPEDVSISTMTISCHVDTYFIIENIGKYIELDPKKIVCVKCDNIGGERSLLELRKRKKKCNKDKKRQNFYNQTTVLVKPSPEKNHINIKLFKNGSIQMTGVKSIKDCISAIDILFIELKKIRGILQKDKIIPINFVTKPNETSIEKIKDFKICMINSGFKIGFKLDREALYDIVVQDQSVQCKYDLDNHACVDVKYFYKERKKISIFIFEKGSIIITGANHCSHILEAYKYITNVLLTNYKKIKSIDPVLEFDDIRKYLII